MLASSSISDAICRNQRALGSLRLPKRYLVPLHWQRPNARWRPPGVFQTLNPQPSTLNPQPSTPNLQPSTFNPQPSTLNKPSTINRSVRSNDFTMLSRSIVLFSGCRFAMQSANVVNVGRHLHRAEADQQTACYKIEQSGTGQCRSRILGGRWGAQRRQGKCQGLQGRGGTQTRKHITHTMYEHACVHMYVCTHVVHVPCLCAQK
jgi:hypothetical protein